MSLPRLIAGFPDTLQVFIMIEITYNHAGDYGPGWAAGSRRFHDWAAVAAWLKDLLDNGKEVLITSYREV